MTCMRGFAGSIRLCLLLFFAFSLTGCFFEEIIYFDRKETDGFEKKDINTFEEEEIKVFKKSGINNIEQFQLLVSDINEALNNKQIKILSTSFSEIFNCIEGDLKSRLNNFYVTWHSFTFDDLNAYLTKFSKDIDEQRKNLVTSYIKKLKLIKNDEFSKVMQYLDGALLNNEINILRECQTGYFGDVGFKLFLDYQSYQKEYLRLKGIKNLYFKRQDLLHVLSPTIS